MDANAPTTTTATATVLSERDAGAALCLMAALADGLRPEERARLGEAFDSLAGVDSALLFKDVLLGHVGMADAYYEGGRTLEAVRVREFGQDVGR